MSNSKIGMVCVEPGEIVFYQLWSEFQGVFYSVNALMFPFMRFWLFSMGIFFSCLLETFRTKKI